MLIIVTDTSLGRGAETFMQPLPYKQLLFSDYSYYTSLQHILSAFHTLKFSENWITWGSSSSSPAHFHSSWVSSGRASTPPQMLMWSHHSWSAASCSSSSLYGRRGETASIPLHPPTSSRHLTAGTSLRHVSHWQSLICSIIPLLSFGRP